MSTHGKEAGRFSREGSLRNASDGSGKSLVVVHGCGVMLSIWKWSKASGMGTNKTRHMKGKWDNALDTIDQLLSEARDGTVGK